MGRAVHRGAGQARVLAQMSTSTLWLAAAPDNVDLRRADALRQKALNDAAPRVAGRPA